MPCAPCLGGCGLPGLELLANGACRRELASASKFGPRGSLEVTTFFPEIGGEVTFDALLDDDCDDLREGTTCLLLLAPVLACTADFDLAGFWSSPGSLEFLSPEVRVSGRGTFDLELLMLVFFSLRDEDVTCSRRDALSPFPVTVASEKGDPNEMTASSLPLDGICRGRSGIGEKTVVFLES